MRAILIRHELPPARERDGGSWRQFLSQQAATILAYDFLTVETIWRRRGAPRDEPTPLYGSGQLPGPLLVEWTRGPEFKSRRPDKRKASH